MTSGRHYDMSMTFKTNFYALRVLRYCDIKQACHGKEILSLWKANITLMRSSSSFGGYSIFEFFTEEFPVDIDDE